MNRKKFLTAASVMATAATLKGCSLLNSSILNASKPLPIVDTHQHLVDTNRFGTGWSRPPVPGNYGIPEYLEATKNVNLVKAVYMEVAVPPDRRHEEAMYAIELCKDKTNPTVAAVISTDLYSTYFEEYMSQFKNSAYIKGIRGSFKSREDILNEQVVKNVYSLGKMNLSFDFTLLPSALSTVVKLIRSCPETRFLVDHCGNVDPRAFLEPGKFTGKPDHDRDQWIFDMKNLAAEKNVVLKISGIVTRSQGYSLTAENLGPAINQCLDIFGPDRVMFAGDWPWCLKSMEIESWINILKNVVANRSYEAQKKLFHDNAIKFYNI